MAKCIRCKKELIGLVPRNWLYVYNASHDPYIVGMGFYPDDMILEQLCSIVGNDGRHKLVLGLCPDCQLSDKQIENIGDGVEYATY